MAGNSNSGRPVLPRNLRGDALIDLDCQLDELREMVGAIDQMVAHVRRRAASINRLRHQAVDSLTLADAEQDRMDSGLSAMGRERIGWDGTDRRASERRLQVAA